MLARRFMMNQLSEETNKAGDVAYWDGSKVKTIDVNKWNNGLGIAVGVVVVPKGFAPDGKTRIVGLNWFDGDGNRTNYMNYFTWSKDYYQSVNEGGQLFPITNNNSVSYDSLSHGSGYFPSDMFSGNISYVDPESKYIEEVGYMIPSPYYIDSPNESYHSEVGSGVGTNASALDFDGLQYSNNISNDYLGSYYYQCAGYACLKYNDGVSNLQYYLPALGEMGYLMARLGKINSTISALNGNIIKGYLWSSSAYDRSDAFYLNTSEGYVKNNVKNYADVVSARSFAIID